MNKNKNRFPAILSSDGYKLSKLKSIWIALILMSAIALLYFIIVLISNNIIDLIVKSGAEQTEIDTLVLAMSSLKELLVNGSAQVCSVELFVAIICCIFIGKDFSNGAISINIARGANKRHIYFSKLITMCALTLAYSIFCLIICGIFVAIAGGVQGFNGDSFGLLARNFVLQILCGFSSVSIFVMIAFLTRSSGSSLACTIGAYIVLSVVISIVNFATTTIGAQSSDWIMFMPFRQSEIATSLTELRDVEIIAVSIMPIIYFAASTLIGYFSFEKRDVK